MSKLLSLSKLFGVTTDYLLDDEAEEEKEAARKKTEEMYANFTDDDWKALGDNY